MWKAVHAPILFEPNPDLFESGMAKIIVRAGQELFCDTTCRHRANPSTRVCLLPCHVGAVGVASLRQSYACWKAGVDPDEYAKVHKEFARAFVSVISVADKLHSGWREKLITQKAGSK
jgi:hypothetical protein